MTKPTQRKNETNTQTSKKSVAYESQKYSEIDEFIFKYEPEKWLEYRKIK